MKSKVETFGDQVLACGPELKAFAISLCGNADRADDLVQETYLRAFANQDSFIMGSNMPAWLFTILRNLFRSEYRKRRREVEDVEGTYSKLLKIPPNQDAHMDFEDFRAAFGKLTHDQREALILVGASGFSHEDAAQILGCAVGTTKSRLNRARAKLASMLETFEPGGLNRKSWFDNAPLRAPTVSIAGLMFELTSSCVLPNGKMQQVYQALN